MKKQIQFFFILLGCLAFNHAIAQINYKWVKGISSTGLGNDKGYSIAVDDSGFVYVTGSFGAGIAPADFNPFGTPVSLVGSGVRNCFFAKYTANGDCVWAKTLDAYNLSSWSSGASIAVDTAGNVYLAGAFWGTVDFNTSNQVISYASSSGELDGFVAKYDNSGNFMWVRSQGGLLVDITNSVALDITGNVYVTGVFKSANFESTIGGVLFSAIGGVEDIFITKYDNAGIFQWSNQIGGADRDIATSITVDKSGNAYLTGSFKGSVDFDPGPGIINQISLGTQDAIFFAKYDSFGGYVIAQKLSGSAGSGVGTSIAVDTAGKFYLTGAFSGTIAFDPMGGQIQTSKGVKDLFYAKYNQLGEYEFAYPIGAPATSAVDSALGSCIVVDNEGDIYITGSFQGDADFDPSITVDDTHTSGSDGGDIFFAKYDNAGNYLWAKSLCAGVEDAGTGIAVDTAENVYITGYYQGKVNFDVGAGIANRVSSSNTQDIFFVKYRPGGTSTISGNVFDNVGNPVTAGYVYLYTQYTNDGNAAMHLVDITSIQTAGDYAFLEVYEDSYLVLAIADSLTYPLLAATYFSDSTHWEQATPIVITSPFTTFSTATINMRGLLSLNGSASLGGVILEGFGYDRTAGTPIQGTPIGLEGDPGSIIAYTSTDVDGKYIFSNLPAGCYKIYVNIPGLPMDSTYHECLDSLQNINNLDFIADSGSIYIDPLATVKQITPSKTNIHLYPNPNKGIATIQFTIVDANVIQLDVFNLLGEKVAEVLNEKKQAGVVTCKFNADNIGLTAGVYLLKLKIGSEITTIKMIQVE